MNGSYLGNVKIYCRQKDNKCNLHCKLSHIMIGKSKRPIVTKIKFAQRRDGFKMMLKRWAVVKPCKVLKAMLKNCRPLS